MRQPTDAYFVRLDAESPPAGQSAPGTASRRARARVDTRPSGGPARPRRRRRLTGKSVFIALLVVGLGTWVAWAAQRPGGVSGTVHGWISHVRGDVAQVSADPDAAKARRYYAAQYTATGVYPQMTDSDLAAVGVGVGVSIDWCNTHAVVIQGASGGGFSSRLLVAGRDYGEVTGRVDCPGNFANPAPWTIAKK